MAPFAQQPGSISDNGRSSLISAITTAGPSASYSTKGITPTLISSITTIPSTFSTPAATPTYSSKGSPSPTGTSLRGSDPPSKTAIQSSTLAFVLVLTFLLGISLGVLAWKKGWGSRSTANPPPLQRQDSNVTLVDRSSLRRHWRERGVIVGTTELYLQVDGSERHVERSVVQVPEKIHDGIAAS